MVDYIIPQKEVLDLYRKQKSEFNFHQRSDDEFIVFLLDTASRVLSIAHQLTPVIEAVSYENEGQATDTLDAETAEDSESQEESISKSTEAEPDPSSFQSLPALQPCKPETLSSQEDAIFQLAKEIESVANTLLDEQKSSAILSSELNNSSLPMETENLITDTLSNQNISPSVKLSNDQNFKPSVTALPYSMLDMSNIQLDTSVSATMANSENLLNSISLLPGSKKSLSSKPTERSGDSNVFKVDPKGNRHDLLKSKQRRCKVCHKIRRKSCSICDVGLCQQECFLQFHQDFATYNIFVEKYKCFGKNHRARINNLPYSYHKLLAQCGPSSAGFQMFDIEKSIADTQSSSSAISNDHFVFKGDSKAEELSNRSRSFYEQSESSKTLTSINNESSDPNDVNLSQTLSAFQSDPCEDEALQE